MRTVPNPDILKTPQSLVSQITSRLKLGGLSTHWPIKNNGDGVKGSAVLFLITLRKTNFSAEPEICVIFNKRSRKVLQPGDLCCPGGGVEKKDKLISQIMRMPFSPFQTWVQRNPVVKHEKEIADQIALMLTTGLREAWEEMRLNPFKVSFLGVLPVHQLIMFEKNIYPLVGWVPENISLQTNWEVERIVYIPLKNLLNQKNYGRYQLTFKDKEGRSTDEREFPCFVHRGRMKDEILWGATFRITINFLSLVFDFFLPDLENLPTVRGQRGTKYLNGSIWENRKGGSERLRSQD